MGKFNDGVAAVEAQIVGPPVHLATAPRDIASLLLLSRCRLLELMQGLEDQAFICAEESAFAWGATELMLLVEAVLRALKRYDIYHSGAAGWRRDSIDWTDDKAVATVAAKARRLF